MPRKKEEPSHSSGMYCYKISIPCLGGGRERKAFYSSISKTDAKKKAEQWKTEQAVAQQTGVIPSGSGQMTFERWANTWLETYKKGTVKEHTYSFTYRSNLENYLIPYFGKAELMAIRPADCQKYMGTVRQKKGEPLAKSTLEKHILILREIFETAIENDLCYKNPALHIEPPKSAPQAPDRPVWTDAQTKKAESWAKSHEGADGIVIMIHTGIRRSELLGLRWSDIDSENLMIHIQRAVVPTTGKIVEGGTKTKTSNRIIPVEEDFMTWLDSLPHSSAYVIPGPDPKQPYSPNAWAAKFRNIMKKLSEEIGIPPLTPHELRHTFGTILRERGVDIYTIQRVLGHADVSITAGLYVHNDIDVLRNNLKIKIAN